MKRKIMSVEEYEYLRTIDTSTVFEDIKNAIISKTKSDVDASVPLAAYALYRIKTNPDKDYRNIEKFQGEYLDPNYDGEQWFYMTLHASHSMIEEGDEDEEDGPWGRIHGLKDKYSADEFAACALFGNQNKGLNAIPYNLSELVILVSGKKTKGMKIANLLSDGGSFLTEAFVNFPGVKAEGFSYYADHHLTTSFVRLSLIGIDTPVIRAEDHIYPDKDDSYDLIFLQPFAKGDYILENLKRRVDLSDEEELVKSAFEWNYIRKNMDFIKKDGKFIAIFKTGLLTNRTNKAIRKYFLEKGYVEKIISLPEHLYDDEGETALVVFSHGNKNVEMINAKECHTSIRMTGKKLDYLDPESLNKILEIIADGKENYRAVTNREIIKSFWKNRAFTLSFTTASLKTGIYKPINISEYNQ